MVDQEIRVLGDENIIANPKNSQKQYPLTFKAVPNVIVYGRKKADLNFTVPIAEGTNFNFNLERTAIIFSDSFNLEEYSYIMVKNPFEEISDFFYVSSLEELDPTGKEFNEFNDEVVKWLRRLVNIISNRCMIFETTLFKDLNNFPNIKSGQTFIRTEDGWTGITIRDINSELDLIFNKYVEEINKKIQEHQTQMNELLEQWKQDIQKYAENVKQYEIVRVVTQTGHGFVFEPVMYSISQRKFVKAVFPHGADGVAVRVDDNNFRLVWAGRVEIPATAKDTQQRDFVLGEYYFLGEGSNGGVQREKPDTYYQHLFQVMYSDELRQNIADVLLSVPINQKGKRWDVGEAKTTVNDIEELKMSDFPVGKVVEVLGYYKTGDGADHKRIISTSDDGSGVQLNNELWANIVHNGEVNVSWFGNNLEKFLNYKCEQHTIDNVVTISKEIIIDYKLHLRFINSSFINYTTKEAHILIRPNSQNIDGHILLENFRAKTNILVDKSITIDGANIPFWSESANATLKKQVVINNMEICSFDDKIGTTGFDVGLNIKKFWGVYITNYSFKGMGNKSYAGLVVQGSNVSCYTYLTNLNINWCKYAVLFTDHLEGVYLNVFDFISVNYGIQAGFLDDKFSEQAENNQTVVQLNVDNGHIDLNNSENTNCIKLKETFQGSFKNLNLYCSQSDTTTTEMIYIEKGEFNVFENIKIINNSRSKNVIGVNCKSILSSFNNIWAKELLTIAKINGRQNDFNNNFGYNLKYLYIFDKEMNIGNKFYGANKTINNTILTTVDYIALNTELEKTIYNETKIFNVQSPSKIHTVHFVPYNLIKKENIVANEVSNNFLKARYAYDDSLDNDIVVEICDIRDIDINYNFRVNISYEDYSFKIINQEQMLKNLNITLNSYYYITEMKQENVYDDYISYIDEKTVYDKQQRKLEEQRQLAYEEALKENPELTYEEFMSVQPMTLNLVEEPQPSDALKKFMEKYL